MDVEQEAQCTDNKLLFNWAFPMSQALYIHCLTVILNIISTKQVYYYPHFTDKDPETQRVQNTLSV